MDVAAIVLFQDCSYSVDGVISSRLGDFMMQLGGSHVTCMYAKIIKNAKSSED